MQAHSSRTSISQSAIPLQNPDEGWYKLNVDASFSLEDSKGAWGAILCDHSGKILFSAWGTIPHCQDAETAEAIAVLEGVKAMIPVPDK